MALSICQRSHALNLALMMLGLAALGGVDGIGFFDNFNMFSGSCLGKAFESFVLDEVESWRSFSSSHFALSTRQSQRPARNDCFSARLLCFFHTCNIHYIQIHLFSLLL